jgi:aminoglycoside phosphotransferase (APT) family kinase protein
VSDPGELDAERAGAALAAAGLKASAATFVRLGTAALARVGDEAVVVGDAARARRAHAVGLALEAAGVAAMRPHDPPVVLSGGLDGLAVSRWGWVPTEPGAAVTPEDLGHLAAAVGAVDPQRCPGVPELAWLGEYRRRLDSHRSAGRLDAEEHAVMVSAWDDLEQRRIRAGPDQRRLVHGDLHDGNVVPGPDGPVLVDFELSGLGPAPAELAVQLCLERRYGQPPDRTDRVLNAAGVTNTAAWRSDPGVGALADLYAWVVTVLALAVRRRSEAEAAETAVRLATWRDGEGRRWQRI